MQNEIKVLKIGQKFVIEENKTIKQLSGNIVVIPKGTEGYVAGNGYIIITEGINAGQWVPVDSRRYRIEDIDYDGVASVVVTGLIQDGYDLDRKAFMLVADYLRSVAIK